MPVVSINYYTSIGINVIEELYFSVPAMDNESDPEDLPELKINSKNKSLNINSKLHLNSLSFQVEIMTDFLMSGSYKLLLLKLSEVDKDANINVQLQDFNCVKDKQCLISERTSKNIERLRAVLTNGDYLLLIVNLSNYFSKDEKNSENYDFNHSDKLIQYKIEYAPITLRYDFKKLDGQQENRFTCLGAKLPLKLNVSKQLKINERVIMDLDNEQDTSEVYIKEDSILRIVTFYEKGNAVDLSVFAENDTGDKFDEIFNVISSDKSSIDKDNNSFKDKLTNIIIDKLKLESGSKKREKLKAFSTNFSEADGIVIPLKGNKRYRIVFDYKASVIDASTGFGNASETSCETFNLQLEIKAISLLKANYPYLFNSCSDSEKKRTTKSRLANYLKDFANASKDHTTYTQINDNNDEYKEESFEYELDLKKSNGILMMSSFKLEKDISLYAEIESEFTTSYL